MPTPRNSRADTLINAMLNAVGGDEPSPSPLPRESLLLPPPCQYHPRPPGSPRDDPPPEPPPEPPPRPLRPPVLLLPLSRPAESAPAALVPTWLPSKDGG